MNYYLNNRHIMNNQITNNVISNLRTPVPRTLQFDSISLWRGRGKRLLFFLFTILPLTVSAQNLKVITGDINCGPVGYESPVTAVFELQNKGSHKLRINDVKVSCGCTSVEYPRTDIPGGQKFEIKMTYDSRQLGHFQKMAAVYSNGSDKPIYLKMKGVVMAELQDYSGTYPLSIGDLRIDKDELEFDDVNKGEQPIQEIHIYNAGSAVCQPNLMHLPPYLTATMSPERLSPGRAGKMTITLNSDMLHDYGLTQTSIYLAQNPGDRVNMGNDIGVAAVLLPSFAHITDVDKANAPRLRMSAEQLTFEFNGKSKQKGEITLTNDGRSTLKISSLQMFTAGLKVTLPKRELKPGETVKLKITGIQKDLKRARSKPRVLMITNDPDKSKVVITVNVK